MSVLSSLTTTRTRNASFSGSEDDVGSSSGVYTGGAAAIAARTWTKLSGTENVFAVVPEPPPNAVHVSDSGQRGGCTPGANSSVYVYECARGAATLPAMFTEPVVPSGVHHVGDVMSACGGIAPRATMRTAALAFSLPQPLIWSQPAAVM